MSIENWDEDQYLDSSYSINNKKFMRISISEKWKQHEQWCKAYKENRKKKYHKKLQNGVAWLQYTR